MMTTMGRGIAQVHVFWTKFCLMVVLASSLLILNNHGGGVVVSFQPVAFRNHQRAALSTSPLLLGRFSSTSTTTASGSTTSTTMTITTTTTTLSATAAASKSNPEDPQVMATGYSQALDIAVAIQEATDMALQALPHRLEGHGDEDARKIDLAIISVSSLYDGTSSPSEIVPAILQAASVYGNGIQHLIGSTSGGFVSSMANLDDSSSDKGDDTRAQDKVRACLPIEQEGVPGVSVTFCILPDVHLKTFHVLGDNVPDDDGETSSDAWKQSVGLVGFDGPAGPDENAAVMLLPSPAFKNVLDELLRGLNTQYPTNTKVFGAIASTVSSLSRARLFRYDVSDKDCIQTLADGCVGVAMNGDIKVQSMLAQGAKPVGGVYKIVKGEKTTIQVVALDEPATELMRAAEQDSDDEEDEDEIVDDSNTKAKITQAYAKARIPKPVLAEANFIMKTLSDDDQAFMAKALLVGLERGGPIGLLPSELGRLAEGKSPRFIVHQVASAASKDGAVTLTMGSVDVQPGMKMRFYVRESDFAKKEVEALWTGCAKTSTFTPTGCFMFPTLDRGSKFFFGKAGFESGAVSEYLPTIPCISGFFSKGVVCALSTDQVLEKSEAATLYASASGYVLFGSNSGRPLYSPAQAIADEVASGDQTATKEEEQRKLEAEDKKRKRLAKSIDTEKKAPRDENGELVLKRREVHSGRALTVSTVEWSVAENMATPTSTLEGFMWDKETEVDRFRERVPLSNLVSQSKLASGDPNNLPPRDWLAPVKEAAAGGKFVIIPECKRTEPTSGSLRKRYDVSKLVKDFTLAGVPAISVNCDGVLFGGSLDDVSAAREGASVPPILASDLLLYPYQLYKMRLAGADAVNLVVGALEPKDLVYLTKIAASLQMQTLLSVTSTVQIKNLGILAAGGFGGLIISNRMLEDFSFDLTGEQAMDILKSDELKEFREKHGDGIPILVEGRVGIIKSKEDGSVLDYVKKLKEAGATGAIVGGGLVRDSETNKNPLESLLQAS